MFLTTLFQCKNRIIDGFKTIDGVKATKIKKTDKMWFINRWSFMVEKQNLFMTEAVTLFYLCHPIDDVYMEGKYAAGSFRGGV